MKIYRKVKHRIILSLKLFIDFLSLSIEKKTYLLSALISNGKVNFTANVSFYMVIT